MVAFFKGFGRDARGNVVMIAALAAIPLVAAGGVAVDYTRALQFKTSLQGVVDSSALAGASELGNTSLASSMATTYITAGIANLPPNNGVTPTVTVPNTTTVTVAATGNVPTTFMSMFGVSSIPVTVTATAGPAQGPGGTQTITISLNGFYSSAYDDNTAYWYIVPDDNSIPPASALTPFYSNTTSVPAPEPFQIGSNQKIGFAVQNITGGRISYGSNGYGRSPGSVQWFYSHLSPPSSEAYPGEGQNNLKACLNSNASQCVNGPLSTTSTASPTCAQLGTNSLTHAWNDMGGNPDDLDYNDIEYTFSCTTSGGNNVWNNSNGGVNGVVLIK